MLRYKEENDALWTTLFQTREFIDFSRNVNINTTFPELCIAGLADMHTLQILKFTINFVSSVI